MSGRGKSFYGHEEVKVRLDGRLVDLDRDIAPLIKECWKAGVVTEQSCQEREPGKAWITFPTVEDVVDFLGITQRKYRPRVEWWDEGEGGWISTQANLYLLFPAADIPELVRDFKAFNKWAKQQEAGKQKGKGGK